MTNKIKLDIDPFGPCSMCTDEGKQILGSKGIIEHMTIFKRQDGHIHVHGPIKNEPLIIEFIQAICSQCDIGIGFSNDKDGKELERRVELSEKGSMNPTVEGSETTDP